MTVVPEKVIFRSVTVYFIYCILLLVTAHTFIKNSDSVLKFFNFHYEIRKWNKNFTQNVENVKANLTKRGKHLSVPVETQIDLANSFIQIVKGKYKTWTIYLVIEYSICFSIIFCQYPEMMGTLLICISKMATPGRLLFSYDLYRGYFL